ncbi:hypothetical protein GGU10DRAFT_371251 [Lentinula aff. detonsa]|uniref:C2H2-type domain-containing protein n=1 Tax=Lentinula aff. detonsa TaxID=2804958 RepID=A0AA38NSL6_9AGAR|nr:hypothetical protein GGU10DRAFT_371251 [Lentinula aff. detonsa]
MTLKAVGLENSFQNAPNSSHQQHASGNDDLDDSDCTSPSTELTEQCTDDCHFITCVDPTHKAANCTASGDTLACNDLEDCNGLEGYLQCCTDLHQHQYIPGPKGYFSAYHWHSGSSTEYRTEETNNFHPNYPNNQLGTSYSLQVPDISHPQDSSPASNLFGTNLPSQLPEYSFDYSQQYELNSQAHSTVTSPLLLSHPTFSPSPPHMSPTHTPMSLNALEQQVSSGVPNSSTVCMWGNCNAQFSSPDELIKHVNAEHLMLLPSETSTQHVLTCQSDEEQQKKFSCLWRDCHELFPDLVDAPSNDRPHPPFDELTIHILSHHLGYPGPNQPPLPKFPDDYPKDYVDMYAHLFPNASESIVATSDSSQSDSGPSRSVTPPFSLEEQEHSHQCKASHVCHWNDCGLTFDSCNDLTSHLAGIHVGSGKPHYDCYWGECGRNGQNGFTSKQKICRHLQSHTGHRPFQCNLCHQNFSEAATLQQHMRRHTREKPYLCDHPGCGKSFAITGALTIHKRTHNGYKPFKCTFCDRAFAESSNLSKHLRTHTGARPYTCHEPGCNKSFARPDQLTRHGKVHRKKAKTGAAL